MVDAADKDRFQDAKMELEVIVFSIIPKHVPLLILGNKIDIKNAVSEKELRIALNLGFTTGKNSLDVPKGLRPIELFMCSLVKRVGLAQGLRWLCWQMRNSF